MSTTARTSLSSTMRTTTPQTPLCCRHQPRLAILTTSTRGIQRGGTDQKGVARCPPAAAAIVVVINGGGGMGANNQRPLSHAPDRRPTDNIATVVVGFPPLSTPPCDPFPSSVSLFCCHYCIHLHHGRRQAGTPCCIPHLCPPSPSHPVPLLSAIVLADSSLDSILRNTTAIHKLVEGGLCCCCM
jgi:hypothetical protein